MTKRYTNDSLRAQPEILSMGHWKNVLQRRLNKCRQIKITARGHSHKSYAEVLRHKENHQHRKEPNGKGAPK